MPKKYIRRIVCVLMIIATVFNCNYAGATDIEREGQIDARSDNLLTADVTFTISAYGAASISAGVAGVNGTTKVVMTVKLQRYNTSTSSWERVQNWKVTENGKMAEFEDVYGLFTHGRYRVRIVAVITRNGVDEQIAFNSVEHVY
ncbi:MAG: hypothetical protein E7267_04645 [Lachnospiraceae bacterium]|nr:hypothetical protein [Lachnospiraceae bacterium]